MITARRLTFLRFKGSWQYLFRQIVHSKFIPLTVFVLFQLLPGHEVWGLEYCKALDTIDKNDLRQLEFYLSLDKSYSHATCKSETLVMRAVRLKSYPALELLLKYKVDPNVAAKAPNGHTMYPLGAALDDLKMVELLIKAGADPNANDGSYLQNAAANADLALVALLLKSGAKVNQASNSGTPLIEAVRSPKPIEQTMPVVEALLNAGADPTLKSKYGLVPILEAACKPSLVAEIARRGGEINVTSKEYGSESDSVLHACIHHRRAVKDIEGLEKIGLIIDKSDWKALSLAASSGNRETIDYLLSKGIVLPESPNDRLAILTIPLKDDEPDIALFKRLLAAGGTNEDESRAVLQALESSITHCNVKYAKKLVAAGAKVSDLMLERTYGDGHYGSIAEWLEANVRGGNCSPQDWKSCRDTLGYLKTKGLYRAKIPSPSKQRLLPLDKQREEDCAALSQGR